MLLALFLALAAQDEEPEFKPSLEVESAEEAWRETGFRVALGYVYDEVFGVGGVPAGVHHSAVLRVGPRLDADWSLLASFRYGVKLSGALGGLRFGGTIEPTYHLTDAWTLSIGAGIGGFVINETGAQTPPVQTVATFTLPGTDPLLRACQGAGLLAILRTEYTFYVSTLFGTGPALQFDAQWTQCTEQLNRSDPDTGEAIVLRQYWVNYGLSVAWLFWWR
jgi:hypothetical protein